MVLRKRDFREGLRSGIKSLIDQEIRILRLERALTPRIIMDELSQSIQSAKMEIIRLSRAMEDEERTKLLKRMIQKTIDEEIDRAIQLRKTRCIRCLHMRFYDQSGSAHVRLPRGTRRAHNIGCDKLRPDLERKCRRFEETPFAVSLEDYLSEMILLYEFRDLIDQMEEIWKDYLIKQ
ncbi:MAG: hypothetical protein A2169_05555 [Deltaproteobacteria bacterium RBG_13_47_9]|nr:MAG: hypothetical protein A2169_05555 [Deltaproteobacteria bacterium RBG_13_47_9]